MQGHLHVHLIPGLLAVFYLRPESALLHPRVLHLVPVAFLLLLGLALDAVQALRPLRLRHQSAHLIDARPMGRRFLLLYLAGVMLVSSALDLPGNAVDLWVEAALGIGFSFNLAHSIGFPQHGSLNHPVILLFAGFVGSLLRHEG
jgi:hypothetical protein